MLHITGTVKEKRYHSCHMSHEILMSMTCCLFGKSQTKAGHESGSIMGNVTHGSRSPADMALSGSGCGFCGGGYPPWVPVDLSNF